MLGEGTGTGNTLVQVLGANKGDQQGSSRNRLRELL